MRITHGRYILTNKQQIESELAQQDKKIELLRAQLNLAQQWTRAQLDLHQPYTHGLDISCHEPEKMQDALAAQILRNLWCSRCSNPWPCKHIGNLRLLRDVTGRVTDLADLREIADRLSAIEPPEPRKGQLDVGL